jgi:hypothetical protein
MNGPINGQELLAVEVCGVSDTRFDHLIPEFLEAMDDIGRYGSEKYGVESFQYRRMAGDKFYFAGLDEEEYAGKSE